MFHTKVLSLDKTFAKTALIKLAMFAGLVGIATFAPLLGHQQMITGPLVNATLFLSVILLGRESAILVGLIPSLIALWSGLLPPILAPMVPFIMFSNTLLILVFGMLKKKYWLGMIFASALKFIFLLSTSSIVINLLFKKEIATQVAQMMSWPQLVTAIAGGIIAFLILKSSRKI